VSILFRLFKFESKVAHGAFHALSIIASVSTVATNVVPTEYKPVVVAAITLAQAVVALVNHNGPKT